MDTIHKDSPSDGVHQKFAAGRRTLGPLIQRSSRNGDIWGRHTQPDPRHGHGNRKESEWMTA